MAVSILGGPFVGVLGGPFVGVLIIPDLLFEVHIGASGFWKMPGWAWDLL